MERHRKSTRAPVGGVRVGILLLVLALVPIAGASWLGWSRYAHFRDTRSELASVDTTTQRLLTLTELRVALYEEAKWRAANEGLEAIGSDASLVLALTGVSIDDELTDAMAISDDAIRELGLIRLSGSLAAVRADRDLSDADDTILAYTEIERIVAAESAATLSDAIQVAGQVDDGTELLQVIRVLESAIDARQIIASQFTTYFGALFVDDPAAASESSTARLIAAMALHDAALESIERTALDGSTAAGQVQALESSSGITTFRLAVDELIETTLRDGVTTGDLSVPRVLAQASSVLEVFNASLITADEHQALLDAAGRDVTRIGADLKTTTSAEMREALLVLTVLVAISLLFAVAVTHAIDAPLRRLSVAAKRLRDGDVSTSVRVTGPTEVRRAAIAINEAASHLELAERQAHALALGELESGALEESAAGKLGASLQDAVQTLAASLAEREEFRHRLAHEAAHDALTNLPNRAFSLAHLRHALARAERTHNDLAVLFIDLDGFKDVNDTRGHGAGDELLQEVADRLQSSVRAGDHVGRLGGDEFLVIAEPVGGAYEAVHLGERLIRAVSEPMTIDNTTVQVGASIGIAMSEDGADAATLLRDADIAVYHAKDHGRGRVELCDEHLRSAVFHQADLEQSLNRALLADEFDVHYQPIVRADAGMTVEMEALIRWRRPGCGIVTPADFIEAAERTDLIVGIDQWMVDRVAEQLARWSSEPAFADLAVAVNVSARFLDTLDFPDRLLGPLYRRGVDPHRLIVEVTEGSVLRDLAAAARKLAHLRAQGVRIAIDDFGTGYTSLAHLRTLPLDRLKLDRSFTTDALTNIQERTLIKLIIDTGHLLGLEITAEGIETAEQAALLRRLGADTLQGYYFGRPAMAVPAPDVAALTA